MTDDEVCVNGVRLNRTPIIVHITCQHRTTLWGKRLPSKHAGPDSHPVRIGWEAFRSGPDDSCTMACFRTESVLAKTRHNQPELNRIRAGFAQYYPGRLWKNGTEFESGKLVAGLLRPVRNRASDSCTPACFQTRCVWPNPDQTIQIGSGSVLRMIHAFFWKMEPEMRTREVGSGICDPVRVWLQAGRNGHNWP